MIAYKFLTADRRGPFSRSRWPDPGTFTTDAVISTCKSGYHACSRSSLSYWLGPSLWLVELAGRIETSRTKLVAGRARLLHEVTRWPQATDSFAESCMAELRAMTRMTFPVGDRRPALIAEYLADALEISEIKRRSSLDLFVAADIAYITAHARSIAGSADGLDPYVSEKVRQNRWLEDNLRLDEVEHGRN